MRIVLIPGLVLALLVAGCAGDDGASGTGTTTTVVAAFFPLAEAARIAGGDGVAVTDLTPSGIEPHDLELTTDHLDAILDADLAVVLGGGFQPAVEDVAADRDGPTVVVLDELGFDVEDPHVWLDPTAMARIVEVVAAGLGADPPAEALTDLAALDGRFRATLGTCERDLVVVAHEAFGHLTDRYRLRQAAISGLAPEAEPDPATLDRLARLIEDDGVTTVFAEPLLPRRAAETLAREAGVTVATLDPLESDPGDGYVAAMEANLAALAEGLGCG